MIADLGEVCFGNFATEFGINLPTNAEAFDIPA